jgi:hypothetical protein
MRTRVTIAREVVDLAPQEAADRMAAIRAILAKFAPYLLTPTPIPATIEVKQSRGEKEQ